MSMINIPNIAVFRGEKDVVDYISVLLDSLGTAKSLTFNTSLYHNWSATNNKSGETFQVLEMDHAHQNPWHTWFTVATSDNQGFPIPSHDSRQLKMSLSTLQNMTSATSKQLRESCSLKESSIKAIEAFFDNDSPV
ncbi:hypothetical protein BGZ46_007014 [Entomortierella lignicola]|nr:hypothetical protein BGZ46_007014 [Entomortierella lignicola]